MKAVTHLLLTISFYLFTLNVCYTQDSLSVTNLVEVSYSFDVVDGKLVGEGADFLIKEMSNAQYTCIGEFHGSINISELTEAIIPELHKADYRHMALEIGPNAGAYFDRLPYDKRAVESELKAFNQKYMVYDSTDSYEPIPFFDKVADANFLGEAKEKEWSILGIDQEYMFANQMLIDWMYDNLSKADQQKYQQKYNAISDSITDMYMQWDATGVAPFTAIIESSYIQEYLSDMKTTAANISLVDALNRSAQIYHMNTVGLWYESNGERIKYMKEQLKLGLRDKNFNMTKDKLLIKMGGYHLSQGLTPLGHFEVGNMLNELAEYHGNEAVNIGFTSRYEMENDTLIDRLDSDDYRAQRMKNFIAMGQKDQWTVIDLRPIRKFTYFYPIKYLLTAWEEKQIMRYDLLIITPTEKEGANNF